MKKELIVGSIVVLAAMSVLALPLFNQNASATLMTAAFSVERLTCGACTENVRQAVGTLDGVSEVQTDVGQKRTVVRFDPKRTSPDLIAATITAAGYPATSIALDAPARPLQPNRSGCGGSCCGQSL
jgi:copper chaperone CopZ